MRPGHRGGRPHGAGFDGPWRRLRLGPSQVSAVRGRHLDTGYECRSWTTRRWDGSWPGAHHGADEWAAQERQEYANDLGDERSLVAVRVGEPKRVLLRVRRRQREPPSSQGSGRDTLRHQAASVGAGVLDVPAHPRPGRLPGGDGERQWLRRGSAAPQERVRTLRADQSRGQFERFSQPDRDRGVGYGRHPHHCRDHTARCRPRSIPRVGAHQATPARRTRVRHPPGPLGAGRACYVALRTGTRELANVMTNVLHARRGGRSRSANPPRCVGRPISRTTGARLSRRTHEGGTSR